MKLNYSSLRNKKLRERSLKNRHFISLILDIWTWIRIDLQKEWEEWLRKMIVAPTILWNRAIIMNLSWEETYPLWRKGYFEVLESEEEMLMKGSLSSWRKSENDFLLCFSLRRDEYRDLWEENLWEMKRCGESVRYSFHSLGFFGISVPRIIVCPFK